jgi:DNA-binding MarR family transcriptional regulator
MATKTFTGLQGSSLEAWRSYLQSQRSILRELDADLVAVHGLTARDYEVLLYLAQAPDCKLPMSALAESTMLTRSGVTRLIDGLVSAGLIERDSCASDARVSYARLTETGFTKLRDAGRTHIAGIRRLFLEHFSDEEIERLAELLGRLPGAPVAGTCSVEDRVD